MESVQGYNLYGSAFGATKMMAYLEKHRLLEISRRLLLELGLARTTEVRKYIKKNLRRISNEVHTKRMFVLTPPNFDIEAFTHYMHNFYNIPAIIYTKERNGCDGDTILKKFKKFLKSQNLEKKNLIFLNFPESRVECLQFRKEHIDPTSVVEIIPDFQVPFKTRQMLEEQGAQYICKFEQVESYYEKVFHKINFGNRSENKSAKNQINKQTITEICSDLVELMRHTKVTDEETAIGSYLPRIVVFGRKGSGKRTQAIALANRFNLVLIDVRQLIFENIASEDALGEVLRQGTEKHDFSKDAVNSIIYKRILQKDCLQNGWVMVGVPHDVDGLKDMGNFIVPPNKIVVIHCRERVALRRLNKMLCSGYYVGLKTDRDECGSHNSSEYLDRNELNEMALEELNLFNTSKHELLEYLATRSETIHIDGNHSRATVSMKLCTRIEQQQTIVGTQMSKNFAKSCEIHKSTNSTTSCSLKLK